MEGVGRCKKMKVGVDKIKAHVAKTKVDARETNWELYNFLLELVLLVLLCYTSFDSIFLSLSLKLYSSQFVSRASTLVLTTWALILSTPTFIFLHLPTPSTRATSKFNFKSLFRVVGCRVTRRAYIYGSFCFNLHSSFLEYLLSF